jgi:putative ABC transport system permease protein
VALVCAFDLASRGVARGFVEIIDTMAGRAALQVAAGHGAPFPEHVVDAVAGVPGVELSVPVMTATAFTVDDSGELLTVQGIDITADAAVRVYSARDEEGLELEDPLVFLSQSDSVMLTRAFANRRGLTMGAPISLETPMGRRRFTVRGLLEPEGVARVYGGNLVVMDLHAAAAAFGRPGFINRIDVVVEREADVTGVRNAIVAVLPSGFQVEAPAQRKADLHRVMQSLQLMMQGIGVVGVLAAFLIAFNRLASVFDARTWQLGMMRAVGVSAGAVWRELLMESLLVGVAGVAIGIPIGIALGRFLLPVVATTTALSYKLIAADTGFAVRPASLVLSAGLGIGAAVLAAALPAWRAARAPAAETIRRLGVEPSRTDPRTMRSIRWLLVGSFVAAVALQLVTRSPALGVVATGLAAVGAALTARPLLDTFRAVQGPLLRRVAGPSARFAASSLAVGGRRAALTIATLGVGLGAVVWLATLATSFERSVVDVLSGVLRCDLFVSSARTASGFLEAPIDDGAATELAAVDGVAAVVGERQVDWEYQGGAITINAIDSRYFITPEFGQYPLFGRAIPDVWAAVARGSAAIVSSNFVLNLGGTLGDTIVLASPRGPVSLQIGGVTTDFASPRGTLEISRELYTRYWHDAQVNRFYVQVDDGADVAAVRASIARTVGRKYGTRILSAGELVGYFATQVRRAFAPFGVLTVMVFVVVLIAVADTLAAGVVERTREFGALRAVGVARQYIGRMVVVESVILGALGLVIALAFGLGLGALWVEATYPYLIGWVLELHIPYEQLAIVVLMTMVVCVVAAVLPAIHAARLDPAEALRYE